MTEGLRLTLDGPLARLTLDRPPLNVLTTEMLRGLARALDEVAARPELRLLRVEAEGRAFSAGVDVADHVGERIAPMMDALAELFERFDRLAVPSVAVVQGAALGGGMELVLATDLAWAAERASFGQPEIRLGLFAPPASVLLPRLVGERRALDLLLGGATIPAREAERIGLVNRVFPDDGFAHAVDEATGRLLELSGAALVLAKRAVREARGLPLPEAGRAVHRLYLDDLMATEDAHEGLAAFRDKRPPAWRHR